MGTVGRPRADPRTSTAEPQEEILEAAADLFATVGYTAASTRAIAEAVGLRQASLFHYYPRKETILSELLDRTVRPTLELTRRLDDAELGPEATVWVVAERDVTNLCRGTHNLGALQLLPEARAEQFAWFWRRRDRLFAFYRRQVRHRPGDRRVRECGPDDRGRPGVRSGGERHHRPSGSPERPGDARPGGRRRTAGPRGSYSQGHPGPHPGPRVPGPGPPDRRTAQVRRRRHPVTVVAACQLEIVIGDLAGNRAKAHAAIVAAAGRGAEIVVLPELSDTGYVFADRDEALALADPDGTLATWTEAAGSTGVVVVGGLCDRAGDTLVNGAAVVDGTGLIARYAKAHLWDRERDVFEPGDGRPPVLDLPVGRLGVMVCYDLEFPDWVRLAAEAGTEILAVPVNWPRFPVPAGERPVEVVKAQAAAATWGIHVVVADRCGTERGVEWVGGSCIIGPTAYRSPPPCPATTHVCWSPPSISGRPATNASEHRTTCSTTVARICTADRRRPRPPHPTGRADRPVGPCRRLAAPARANTPGTIHDLLPGHPPPRGARLPG